MWLQVRWPINQRVADDPHAKANLLIQAHLSALQLPISDYVTDTKTVLDNALRILQACCMAPVPQSVCCPDDGWFLTSPMASSIMQNVPLCTSTRPCDAQRRCAVLAAQPPSVCCAELRSLSCSCLHRNNMPVRAGDD